MYDMKHEKSKRHNEIRLEISNYSTKSPFFSITLFDRAVIDSESPVKVCLEMFFHVNSMNDIKSSVLPYCVPCLHIS